MEYLILRNGASRSNEVVNCSYEVAAAAAPGCPVVPFETVDGDRCAENYLLQDGKLVYSPPPDVPEEVIEKQRAAVTAKAEIKDALADAAEGALDEDFLKLLRLHFMHRDRVAEKWDEAKDPRVKPLSK